MSASLVRDTDVKDREYNGDKLVMTAALFLAIAAFSVALRTYVRVGLTKRFLADDWLMLGRLTIFVIYCSLILCGVKVGIGYHNSVLSQDDESKALKVSCSL